MAGFTREITGKDGAPMVSAPPAELIHCTICPWMALSRVLQCLLPL